jgi:RNA polymerase sigma-70 factor (ECF subfamily)
MGEIPPESVTHLLQAWSAGDEQALAQLMPLVYGELRRIAHRRMSLENPGATLEPTALVNELYLKLAGATGLSFRDRSQFFGLAAQMMRRILVDAARSRGAAKRGGPGGKIPLDEKLAVPSSEKDREIVALDDALNALAKEDARKARVVELRFFGGLGVEETAETLGVSVQTVMRDWTFAQAWLAREMRAGERRSRPPAPRRACPVDLPGFGHGELDDCQAAAFVLVS